MASRFVRVEIVKAGAGSSATGLSAYIARDARLDQSGERFNFAHRADELEAGGLLLPKDAPEWAGDAALVWREAERAEQTLDRQTGEWRWKKGGQIAKHMTIALPREATAAQRQAMLMKFVKQEIQPQRHGVAVEWAIHRDDNNPHAHLLISTRSLSGDGFGKKARGMNPDFASKGARHFIGEAENWDQRWAAFQSAYFQEHGITATVRERRVVAEAHYTRGQMRDAQVTAEREALAQENAAAELARWRDPAQILEQLTAQRAMFTAREVRQALNKSGLEGEAREALEAAITGHAEVIALANGKGEAIGWTTRQVRAEEQAIIDVAERIGAVAGRPLGQGARACLDAAPLLPEQHAAAARVSDGRQLAIVIGRAGTGKSFTLGTARQAFEAEGYRVIGLAPTNAVVADLRKDGYGHAATLHRELGQLERGKTSWDAKTVVMVDEAAMIDNAIMVRLLRAAERSGTKLILAGDDRQFQSVSRGGMFTELVARHGAAELATVHRQTQAYQARASEEFARGEMLAALKAYDQRGQIVWCDSLAEARAQAVAAQSAGEGPGFLYASTNKEVEALNRAEQGRRRAQREAAGELIPAHSFQTVRGEVSIAVGERVQFYATDRKLGIATSEFGTVTAVTPERLEIVKDDGATVSFDPASYDKWGLGYSGTGYKGQGKTQPRTAAVYDNSYAWDSRAAYVIGTRHREDYRLFVPKELAPDLATLVGQIEKPREDRGASLRFVAVAAGQTQDRAVGPQAVRPKRSMFDGLKLNAGRSRQESSGAAPSRPERDQPVVLLHEAVECYARVWSDIGLMRAENLPILDSQRRALREAGAAMDAVRPGATQDLRAALTYEPTTQRAMNGLQGGERAAQLVAGIKHEERVRQEPTLKAARLVKMCSRLEAQHAGLGGWDQAAARGEVERQLHDIAGMVKRDPQLEALMRTLSKAEGIAPNSWLGRVLQAPTLERAVRQNIGQDHGLRLSR
ncbi:AAA family ATPase [Acidocella aromatica]|uniref:Ti-type conjugative transfer relaxase TraA n=1 Tax=Acidocella aromatica TaxID=1303579 RepID=A0A840VFR8_9PROT|nr:AAA family ATPase [Acidocella aromatica]MBB5374536.1 Ti-type conjugative transfer relaxase TraA [Acidocella aromatica]